MRILGIDPGTTLCGWGIIEKEKRGGRLRLVGCGCVVTKKGLALEDRLFKIYNELLKVIKKYKPDALACEELFFFKNVTTAISVAQARGVILLAAKTSKISFAEYTPLQVKQAITGFGRAEKSQMQKMVKIILRLREIPKPDDMADALAIAICHANSVC